MTRSSSAEQIDVASRRVEKVYSVLARVYDGFFDWSLGPGRRQAVARLKAEPGDRVLEVGVGTGLSLPLYPPECHLTGIDISEPMLHQARARLDRIGRAGVDLRRMDAREILFADGSFDAVVAPYVISVVPDPSRVMAEIARVCRPGGTVIVVNRFQSDKPVLRVLDRALTPLTTWIGFRLDLPVAVVTGTPGLEVRAIHRVNLFGGWRLIVLRRV